MGRWQNKLIKAYLPSPQNLLNMDIDSSVGSVATPDEHSLNFLNNGNRTEHDYLVDSNGLPLHHCSDEPYGDTAWIQHRLKRVAQHRRMKLADEYSCHYMFAYAQETNDIKKENKARKAANLWLLRVTKHVSNKRGTPCKN
ncbi:hypothetical protein [Colwellia sp. Bg11-28]|uniref:hypothetical protein n=1 Tax=Colwellia sp. Bg11-28 TaxID=2058305 RepID=UPI000C336E94|nr:hypothetical protein [Colwellia sp. Bg11-28]PKH88269.1 hypothetical protein CXF79_05765 [Colwellia sp. Bg11-28]